MKRIEKHVAIFVALCCMISTVSFAAEPVSQMIQENSVVGQFANYGTISETPEEMLSVLTAEENKINTITTGNISADYFDGEIIKNQLYNCVEVTNVEELNGLLYICYNTSENETVILTYFGYELIAKMIYNRTNDTLVNFDYLDNEYIIWEDFIEGSYYALTEEQLSNIEAALESNDMDAIEAIPDVGVIEDNDSFLIVPYDVTRTSTSQEKTNLELPNPVTISHYNGSQYSNYLGVNRPTSVYEKRNTYTEVSSEVQRFGVGTAITIISAFLTGGASTVQMAFTSMVLSAISLAIDQAGRIEEAARIYRSCEHKYRTELIGFVSDNTKYNNVAVVALYGSDTSGRMAGGYSPDDYTQADWNWVTTTYSSYSNRDDSYYENYAVNAMINYDRDLTSNFGVTSLPTSTP